MASNVIHIESGADLDNYLKSSGLVICYFTAEWCGPCRAIAPVFEKFSNEYSNAKFLKIDIDKNSSHPMVSNIRSVPTFVFYKNGSKISEFAGANQNSLESTIKANI